MKSVKVPVSVGELVDKITILRIKRRKITDVSKLRNIEAELSALAEVCTQEGINSSTELAERLETINLKLWDIEDKIRDKERAKAFDTEFVELARAVYFTNDERFAIKAAINEASGSLYREEKSYQEYK